MLPHLQGYFVLFWEQMCAVGDIFIQAVLTKRGLKMMTPRLITVSRNRNQTGKRVALISSCLSDDLQKQTNVGKPQK